MVLIVRRRRRGGVSIKEIGNAPRSGEWSVTLREVEGVRGIRFGRGAAYDSSPIFFPASHEKEELAIAREAVKIV